MFIFTLSRSLGRVRHTKHSWCVTAMLWGKLAQSGIIVAWREEEGGGGTEIIPSRKGEGEKAISRPRIV